MVGRTTRDPGAGRAHLGFACALIASAFVVAAGCSGDKNYFFYGGGAAGTGAGTSGSAGDSGQSSGAGAGGSSGEVGGSDGGGGGGGVPPGGGGLGGLPASGAAGVAGGTSSGGAPAGGTGGGSPTVPTRLGRACVNDLECDPDGETGLTCLTSTSTELGGGAAPRGVCTLLCSTNETCWSVDPTALCVNFDPLSDYGYCMEGCILGAPGLLEDRPPKCHDRAEFACTPLDSVSTGTPCATSNACGSDLVCFEGECVTLLSSCLPVCTGDQDCSAGLFCDRAEGTCKPQSTAGDPLGAACDPGAATDSCSGYCQVIEDVPGLSGMCGEPCNFGHPCAFEDGATTGVCAFASAINENPEIGDLGFCSQLCDCSSQCRTPSFGCVPLDGFEEAFGRPGLCLYPFDADGTPSETLDCTSPGFACEGDAVLPYPSCNP